MVLLVFGHQVKRYEDASLIAAPRAVVNPRQLCETVAVGGVGAALPTGSGRCRKLAVQADAGNRDAPVILQSGVRLMPDLPPDHWLLDR